jgi:glycosyltransferase involved in cell wall biosynthesis
MLVLGTTSFPRSDDGSEAAGSFVLDVATALAGAGQRVRVVAPGASTTIETPGAELEIYRYCAPQRPLSTLRLTHPLDAGILLQVFREGLSVTRSAVAGADARHMLALWALPTGAWARTACREQGIDYSVWMLGSDVWSLGRIPLVRQWLGGVMRDAKHRFADGLQLAEDAEIICRKPVSFLPSSRSIDADRADAAPPRRAAPYRLLFLGRWHANKGIDLLMEALRQLSDEDWAGIEHVRILGGGPMSQLVHAQGTALQAAGRPVEIGGFVGKSTAEREILDADWVLIPSRIESIPVVFSDALKLSRPVVCSPVGDLPKLVGDGGVGICVNEATATAWVDALRALPKRDAASFNPRIATMAEQFSVDGIARRIIEATRGE